jgi:hypothetical protein
MLLFNIDSLTLEDIMNNRCEVLRMNFDGGLRDRQVFLNQIRSAVMKVTGEKMTLDALINEIAKNIFDHADGKGSLVICREDDLFDFVIKDCGKKSYNFEKSKNHSTLVGNGINCGIGLGMIQDYAEDLGIKLNIDTSEGFSYSGVYKKPPRS